MKKITLFLIITILLSGCASDGVYQAFILEDQSYVLVDDNGEILDDMSYDSYVQVSGVGFIVTRDQETAFISKRGEETIRFGKYESLVNFGSVILGLNEDDFAILNASGQTLHSTRNSELILNDGIPVILSDGIYTVYDSDFNTIATGKKEIISAYSFVDSHTIVNYEDSSLLFYQGANSEGVQIELGGNFQIVGYNAELGHFLCDKSSGKIALVLADEIIFNTDINDFEDFDDELTISFDDDNNILVMYENKINLYNVEGTYVNSLNSYYKGVNEYVISNNEYVYGPHFFYKDGVEFEVNGVQLDPFAGYTYGEIIPVFVNGESFTYYNFDGTPAFEDYFDEAHQFDYNQLAKVKVGSDVYLIDIEGNYITSSYKNIELLGDKYYLGYLTDNQYVVLDNTGVQIIDDVFMGFSKVIFTNGSPHVILTKSIRTLVYNLETLELIFEESGYCTIYNDTFILIGDTFYTLLGKKVWQR